MKIYQFWIILGFIQFTVGNQDINVTTYDDSNNVCPVRWFRRKRELTEYTRWRANQVTTNEFIVKVLDEDLTTTKPDVNKGPEIIGGDKIIRGGVKIHSHRSALLTESLKDYTRFIPPTTTMTRVGGEISPLPGSGLTSNAVLLPLPMNSITSRNPDRDDSPPASPQFLARTPIVAPRQYAPVPPVAFNPRISLAPLEPAPLKPYVNHVWGKPPSFSTSLKPTLSDKNKEEIDDYSNNGNNRDHDREMYMTRTDIVTRTTVRPDCSSSTLPLEEEYDLKPTPPHKYFDNIRKMEEMKKIAEKDPEVSYNMMFYDNEEIQFGSKNKKEESESSEKDNVKNESEIIDEDFVDPKCDELGDIQHKNGTIINLYTNKNSELNKVLARDMASVPMTVDAAVLKERDKRGGYCTLLNLRPLNFESPRTLPEIVFQMRHWAENSPISKWVDITRGNYTAMENPIYMMIIDDPSSGQILSAKQTVMIVAGIQGRDHRAVTAAMYLLFQLIDNSELHTDILTKYRFWIIPVFNPDGYDYSMTFPHRREWKKNLRQIWNYCNGRESCKACQDYGIGCTVQPCYGVNLDRNFEYQWMRAEEIRADHPCGQLYAGERQLSEEETRALIQYLDEQRTRLSTFIALKEGEILGVFYPYSHTRKRRAFDHVYRQRAMRAALAANSIRNAPYVAGQTSEYLPLYAGGIEDWVDGHLGIDNTYTVILNRPSESNSSKSTERVVHEGYAAVEALLHESLENVDPPPLVALTGKRKSSLAIKLFTNPLLMVIALCVLNSYSRYS